MTVRLVLVEAFVLLRHVHEDGRGGPALSEAIEIALDAPEHFRRADGVDVAERAAAERRKSEPEDRADVAVAWAAEEAFAVAEERFVDELERAAHLDFFDGDLRFRLDAERLVDGDVDLLLPLLG